MDELIERCKLKVANLSRLVGEANDLLGWRLRALDALTVADLNWVLEVASEEESKLRGEASAVLQAKQEWVRLSKDELHALNALAESCTSTRLLALRVVSWRVRMLVFETNVSLADAPFLQALESGGEIQSGLRTWVIGVCPQDSRLKIDVDLGDIALAAGASSLAIDILLEHRANLTFLSNEVRLIRREKAYRSDAEVSLVLIAAGEDVKIEGALGSYGHQARPHLLEVHLTGARSRANLNYGFAGDSGIAHRIAAVLSGESCSLNVVALGAAFKSAALQLGVDVRATEGSDGTSSVVQLEGVICNEHASILFSPLHAGESEATTSLTVVGLNPQDIHYCRERGLSAAEGTASLVWALLQPVMRLIDVEKRRLIRYSLLSLAAPGDC